MNFRERYQYDPKKDRLGSGGFASVFRAKDTLLDREVALKIFHAGESEKVNLLGELKQISRLDHPNLIRCYDIVDVAVTNIHGLTETLNVGIMEYADAGHLKDFIKENNDPELSRRLLLQLLQGIAYLHDKGIIHRDLKPQNILLARNGSQLTVKIADFGISKSLSGNTHSSSVLMGTIEYMAPEQFNPAKYGINGKISTNLDLWSFGIIVYEMATRRNLFGGESKSTTAEQIMNAILSFTLPEDIYTLPEPFQSVVKRCLVADANLRVKKASDLADLLSQPVRMAVPPQPAKDEATRVIRKSEEKIAERIEPKQAQKPIQPVVPEPAPPRQAPPASGTATPPAGEKSGRKKINWLAVGAILVALAGGGYYFLQSGSGAKPGAVSPEEDYAFALANLPDTTTGSLARLRRAATAGHDSASLALARYYFDQGEFGKVTGALGNLAEKKDPRAALLLWQTAQKQNPSNKVKTSRLLENCALLGDAECQYELGIRAYQAQKYSQAFDWLSSASLQNHPKAICQLGNMYLEGNSVARNIDSARVLFSRAAGLNNSVALFTLGKFYYDGTYVKEDKTKAAQYFRQVVKNADHKEAVQMSQELLSNLN